MIEKENLPKKGDLILLGTGHYKWFFQKIREPHSGTTSFQTPVLCLFLCAENISKWRQVELKCFVRGSLRLTYVNWAEFYKDVKIIQKP